MKRKLTAIWRLLGCKNYLLVINKELVDGPNIIYDFTLPLSEAKTAAAYLYNIIEENDKLLHEQEETLQAFKELLH